MKMFFQLYRWVFSPLLHASSLAGDASSNGCRFYPSCSNYAETAIRRFGFWHGSFLAVQRFFRCHAWSDGGVDDVPHGNEGR